MKTTMKMVFGSLAACLALGALADDATISRVTVQQRWPWSRLTDIDYVLTADPTQRVDIAVTAYNGSEVLILPTESLSGDLYGVTEGAHRIILDPTKTTYTNSEVLTKFRVALAPTTPPLYMIVDLTKSAGADGQIEYIYESDLTNGLWGAWVRNPVTNNGMVVESVVWTGVTTNDVYKIDKLVLRRISAGTFKMGDSVPPTISTTLTKGFYVGVFEVTQWQWYKMMNSNNSCFQIPTGPVESITYDEIRGATDSNPAVNWPATGVSVLPSSFVGLLRAKTGVGGFDLPTEAQWEYACRAGTTTYFNDGISGSSANQLNELGWWSGNSGSTTHVVGQKNPNAWGLYDTIGNVWERCLDWDSTLTGGSDPAGSAAGSSRVVRGAAWDIDESLPYSPRSADRSSLPPSFVHYGSGFRLVRNLP